MKIRPEHKMGMWELWSYVRGRMAPQKPRRKRQMAWLREASEYTGIVVNVLGGVAYDRDLRQLVKSGHLKMTRHAYEGGMRGGNYNLSRSVLVLTDKGRETLETGVWK